MIKKRKKINFGVLSFLHINFAFRSLSVFEVKTLISRLRVKRLFTLLLFITSYLLKYKYLTKFIDFKIKKGQFHEKK